MKKSIVKTAWSMLREQKILRKHRKVAAFWNQMIAREAAGQLEHFPLRAKMDLPANKVIWQYWGQGIQPDRLPDVVKLCFQSVDTYRGDYTVIRVDDNTLPQYLDIPDFIGSKRKADIISRTFFSDIIRLALLQVYGGVWLDATILLTDELPAEFCEQDYFVYQRDAQEPYTDYWKNSYAYYWGWHEDHQVKMLNSIIFAKKGHALLGQLCQLLFNYWKAADGALDYFFFQILHEQLLPAGKSAGEGLHVSDVYPHLLQTKLSGGNYPMAYPDIFLRTSLHKLTYFPEDTIAQLQQILRQTKTAAPARKEDS
ncbi:capsular polysaccharide synthesis protein [Sphingobacterium sp. 2149]|uniref:capsular polysaccharide synthesis protein n=1 Tax=Sphingobacterium sp. 2149 TaxID=2817763 RepID=UPI002856D73D|nr:capsular polysaccharide synthesis protein [Sphingobacterium sp. 2149]MDR6733880.1 hypothetical protein [Sphingobacterium sp. 2149]